MCGQNEPKIEYRRLTTNSIIATFNTNNVNNKKYEILKYLANFYWIINFKLSRETTISTNQSQDF